VFEEAPCLASHLQDLGWKAVRFSPQQIGVGATSQISQDIKQGLYHLLWIDLPLPGRHISKERMHSAVCQLSRWLQLASEVGTTMVLQKVSNSIITYSYIISKLLSHNFLANFL
jgi:hypothetical protein